MATNKFLIFDENKANLQSDLTYASDPQRINGVVPGQAKSVLHNKLFRQVSIMTYALGELIKNKGIQVDDSDPAILVSALSSAIGPTVVIDNLTSTSTTSALSAKQGKVLNDEKAGKDELINIELGELSSFFAWCANVNPVSIELSLGDTLPPNSIRGLGPQLQKYSNFKGESLSLETLKLSNTENDIFTNINARAEIMTSISICSFLESSPYGKAHYFKTLAEYHMGYNSPPKTVIITADDILLGNIYVKANANGLTDTNSLYLNGVAIILKPTYNVNDVIPLSHYNITEPGSYVLQRVENPSYQSSSCDVFIGNIRNGGE